MSNIEIDIDDIDNDEGNAGEEAVVEDDGSDPEADAPKPEAESPPKTTATTSTTSKKRKRSATDDAETQIIAMMQKAQQAQESLIENFTNDNNDECSHFATALGIQLRRFSAYKRAVAKLKIQQVMLDVEFSNDSLSSASTSASIGNAYRALYD